MTESIPNSDAQEQLSPRIKAVSYAAPGAESDQPAKVSPHVSPLDTNADTPWWYSQFNLMLLVFGLLGLAVLSFITLTPSPTANIADASLTPSETNLNNLSSDSSESPWDESRRAQARTDAQEILSNLLDSKKDLEEKEVQNWAQTDFELALLDAEKGDELYKQQDFQQALQSYQLAVDKLDKLYELIPVYVESKVALGHKALDQGKSLLAEEAFSVALAIEPNNFAAMNGLSRAKILDQALQLSQAAQVDILRFMEEDELELLLSAEQKLKEALGLDNQNTDIQEQLAEVVELQNEKRYRVAMTKGFAALFANNYPVANNAFAQALQLEPDDETARLAYKQSLASNKTSSLESLLNRASEFETNENWQNALSNYQAVLARDPNLVSAKLGKIRSSARHDLDTQLRDVLSDTLALSKVNKKEQAQGVLAEAQAIRVKGPKLEGQITQLTAALALTETTVKVQIMSDTMTEVTLTKAGANQITLGRFANKNLALKPGRYVLTGARFGFHDVRKEIELHPGSEELLTYELSCDQPISMALQEGVDDPA